MQLRPYQIQALDAVKQKYEAGVYRQLVTLPTGTGKTCIFVCVPTYLGLKGRTLVLAHREELIDQAIDKWCRWNPEVKITAEMAERHADPNANVIVASVQTLGRINSSRLLALDPSQFSCLITDECHHSPADSYQAIYRHFGVLNDQSKILHIGTTATPNRADKKGLDKIFSEISFSLDLITAIKEGWLVDLRAYRVITDTNLNSVHTLLGDFKLDELTQAVNTKTRNETVVKHWRELAQGRPTLVFCCDVAHAQSMAQTFKEYGIKAEAIWGDDHERSKKLDELRNRELDVLCNCAVLTEGYDDPAIACIVMARPTQSQLLFSQCIGRGTRIPTEIKNLVDARNAGIQLSKTDCIVIDVVDNCTKHTLVTIPSLFGMAPRMDMKGRKVTAALDHFNKVQEEHPQVDLKDAEDLTRLNSYAESINIFVMKWADEVLTGSKLQWNKTVDGHYVLYLRRGQIHVYEDLLEKWNVTGKFQSDQAIIALDNGFLPACYDDWSTRKEPGKVIDISEHGFPNLPTAFAAAEKYIHENVPEELTLIKREAPWRKESATIGQINLLRKFHIPIKEGLTKGEAQLAIQKLLRRKKA